MDVELIEDLQARRLQSMLSELRPAWTPAELCALLLDLESELVATLSDGPDRAAAECLHSKKLGFKHGTLFAQPMNGEAHDRSCWVETCSKL